MLGMPGEKGTKLLTNAQRMAVDPFRQRPSQFLPTKVCKGASIRVMAEIRQVLIANNMKMIAHSADELSSEVRAVK